MIDLGDLREGIIYKNKDELHEIIEEILKLKSIKLYGIGVNLTCYGAVIPKNDNLSILIQIAEQIEKDFSIKLEMISGGNSSSLHLIEKGELPNKINNLRIGEAFLLGRETSYGHKLDGFNDDAFALEAEIIELQEKPSFPIGEIGVDAFGRKPSYEDKGKTKRAILAVGQQDIDVENILCVDSKAQILGASSDHLIIDVTNSDVTYAVGDIVQFKLKYGSLLRAFTSPYVKKKYI
jgi:predicted amino acid racemase